MRPPHKGRRGRVRSAATALAAAAVAVACTGENLFTGPGVGSGSGTGPVVEITTPTEESTLPVGDSLLVTASAQSEQGSIDMTFVGQYAGTGTGAFAQQIVSLANSVDTTVAVFLQPVGTTPGDVLIIVEAKDVVGGTGADTVLITLN